MSRKTRTLAAAALGMSMLLARSAAAASDHLKCYKIKDSIAKTNYTADVAGLTPETGCKIKVPPKIACVPATKTNVNPPPPGGGGTGTPNSFLCYNLKCPKGVVPPVTLIDQFGVHGLTPGSAKMLCAPAVPPPPVACCQLTISGTPACFDATGADAVIKCPALGGTLSLGPACDGADGTCGTKQALPFCCECPALSGFPHPQYCFESAALTAALGGCPSGCTLVNATCGQNTESCGGL